MKNRKISAILILVCSAAAALLSALPNAVRMDWFGGFTTYHSAYSLIPVGYAIWGPMVAAVAAVIMTVLGVIQIVRPNEKLTKWMIGISAVGVLMNLLSAFLTNMTLIGIIVTALLAADVALLCYEKKQNNN